MGTSRSTHPDAVGDFAPQRVLRMDHSLCLSPCFVEATTTLHVGTGSLLFICPRSAAMPPPSSATEGIQEAITGDPISRSPPARTESKHEIFRKFARPESRPSQPKFRRYFLENRLRPNVRKTFAKSWARANHPEPNSALARAELGPARAELGAAGAEFGCMLGRVGLAASRDGLGRSELG